MSLHPFSTSRRRVASFCILLMACALAAFASPAAPRARLNPAGARRARTAADPTPTPPPTVTFLTEYGFSAPDGGNLVNSDGINPSALVQPYLGYGALFGTTSTGGSNGSGTVFEFTPGNPGSLDPFYPFSTLPASTPSTNPDGAYPTAGLVPAGTNGSFDGNYLGTTSAGGVNGSGTIFLVNGSDNSVTTIYTFSALAPNDTGSAPYVNQDGATPNAALVSDGVGNYYGTASAGGTEGLGTIFKVTEDGTFTLLHCFSPAEGGVPLGALALRESGQFYGTTSGYGPNGSGTVFEFDPSCDCLSTVYSFTSLDEGPGRGVNQDGAYPLAGLTQYGNSNFYGVTSAGGPNGTGTIFEIIPNAATSSALFDLIYPFSALQQNANYDEVNQDGAGPAAPLILGSDNNLYGTTPYGGANGDGVIFQLLTGSYTFNTLYNFTGGADGGQPVTALTQVDSTDFFGTTAQLTSPLPAKPGKAKARAARPAGSLPDAASNGYGTIFALSVIPAAGVLNLDSNSYDVDESAGSVTLTVTRTGGSTGAVTVSYTTQDGYQSGTAGTDYTAENGTLSWGDGDKTSQTIKVPITDRHLTDGGSVAFFVDLENPTGGAVLGGYYADFLSAYVEIDHNDPAIKPVITSAATASGQVGVSFSYQITANNQPTSFGATGLPGTLTVDSDSGLISGTPTTTGKYTVSLSAMNSGGTGAKTLTLTILPATPDVTSEGVSAQVGVPFSYQITADNNPTSYNATNLPTGLSVDRSTGLISGTPKGAGSFSVNISATNAGGTGTGILGISISASTPKITSPLNARAQIGQPFSYQIKATSSPTNYDATGLPAGLTINTASGLISGTPTATGTYNVQLSADNSNDEGTPASTHRGRLAPDAGTTGTATLVLTVVPATPVITSARSASARIGQSFSYQIKATNGPASFDATGLPMGLSANTTTGLISGTPTVSGSFKVGLKAINAGGTGTATLTLTVVPAKPAITSATTAQGRINQPFSYQIVATGSPTSYAASVLPSGLSVNTATGLISGTPTAAGTFSVGLSASNAGGTGTVTLSLTILPPTPAITSSNSAAAEVGEPFAYQIVATCSPTSYAATGLPSGLTLNTVSGAITGTPTQAGTFTVNLSATNAGGTGTLTLTLQVTVAAPAITGGLSANGQVGQAFSYQITATSSPTSYAATGLPGGLSVNKTTGFISGTPTQAGTFSVGISATNASGTGTATLSLNILPAVPVVTSAATANAMEGAAFTYQITASNTPTSFAASGLPTGLGVDPDTGLISGTPTQAGTFTVGLAASNAGGTGRASLTLTITSTQPVVTSATTASAQINQPFTYQLAASNSPTSFAASNLPAGLGVNTKTGLISGTPTASGTFNVGLSASNATGTGTATLTLTVSAAAVQKPAVTSATTASAQVGQLFTYQITALNKPTSFAATGLPAGLGIDASNGFISGTPTAAGTFSVNLTATNAGGTGTATLTLTVLPAAPVITSATTASAQVGQPFTYQITASHGPASFGANNLPAGLSVGPSTGLISGTPTVTGTFQVGLSAANSGGTGTATLSLTVNAAPVNQPIITSATTADGQVGLAFTYQIVAANNPTAFNATGLPRGLNIDTATGLISGTPENAGSFSIGLSASNTSGTGTATLSLTVVPRTPVITSALNVAAQVGEAFTYQIRATSSPTGYAATGLPPGLGIDPRLGLISGAPTQAGTFNVGLSASNAGGTGTATLNLTVVVAAPVVTSVSTASAQVSQPFAYQITATNNPASYGASHLPAGITITPTTGLIFGTPRVTGTFSVGLSATNAGGTGLATLTLTVTAASTNQPTITSATSATGQAGESFTYQIIATNTPTSYAATGLPSGLNINTTNGFISGTPGVSGTFRVGLSASNAGGTGTAVLTLTVSSSTIPHPSITSANSANGQVGVPFAFQIAASNSPTSYGTSPLPTGLSVNDATGLISGTPTMAGTFVVTVAAANAGGTGTGSLTLNIAEAVQPTIAIVSPPDGITVVVGSTVPLAASVTDPDGALAQVEFFVNGQPVGNSSATGPFAVNTSPQAPGTYVLSAVATDHEGRLSTGSVTITAVAAQGASPAPTAALLTPLNDLNLAAGSTVRLDASAASASAAGLDHVSILVNGAVVATFDANGNPVATGAAPSTPHRQDSSGSGGGNGSFQASFTLPGFDTLLSMIVAATDKLGQTSVTPVTSFHATVTTDRAPVVAFSNLGPDVSVAVGASTQASVAASDPDAGTAPMRARAGAPRAASARLTTRDTGASDPDAVLAQLTYFLNGVQIGASSTPPFGFSFAAPAPGKYLLHAVATDGAGLSSVSAPVEVDAVAPTVTVAAGGDGQASEAGERGKVVFTRTGADESAPLDVFYKTKGPAVAGSDYVALSGRATIPAGANSVKVKVKAIDDTFHEGTRKLKVRLLPSPGGLYQVGDPAGARIFIIDND